MADVAKSDVLTRVDRDLELGHVHPAMQRLASLVAAYPDDLEVRARRAALNRQIGNLVEAGRWGYLTEEVTAAEVCAYERAQPRACTRLSALRLRNDPTAQLGRHAARRYRDLLEQLEQETDDRANQETGRTATPQEPAATAPSRPRSGYSPILVPAMFLMYVAAGFVFVGLAIVGIVTLIRYIV